MDFELTTEQKDIKKAAREFAEGEFEDIAQEYDEKEEFPHELFKKACENGFVGVWIPEEYGGAEYGVMEDALIREEFFRVDPGLAQALTSTTFGSEMIMMFGTDEQKEKYLSPLPTGEAISGGAITEPDAGSDVAGISTRAVKEGDEYVINGNKMFITNATIAKYLSTLCVTNPEEEKRHRRQSVIIVETDRDGFEAEKLHGKMGIRASPTAEVIYKDVRVPVENLVGKEGRGFYQFMEFFDRTRIGVAAQSVGIAQGAFDQALAHAKERKQFGQPIANFQVTQFKLAEMATKVQIARDITYHAAWLFDQGKPNPTISSMAKWYAAESAVRVVDEALQIHGGYGYIADYKISRFYRDVKVQEIYEGTKETEKITIARRLLK
jgi:alkylation response protein AidB-like acyl-CoA dehydrogenase